MHMEQLVKETGVEYYDFGFDPEFSSRSELFFDPDHMNREGAALFSEKKLKPILRERADRPQRGVRK